MDGAALEVEVATAVNSIVILVVDAGVEVLLLCYVSFFTCSVCR
jgi:hypothetical protein